MRIDEKRRVARPVVQFAADRGVIHLKMNLQGRRGWPDDWFFFSVASGGVLIIEFKAPGEDPNELQAHTIRQLLKRGYDVHVVDDPEVGKQLIRDRLEAEKRAAKRVQVHGVKPRRSDLG